MNPSGSGNGDIAQVLAATDIVQLIGQTVALKRRGTSYVGLCPFHQEKTPSFHVHADKQFYHCFGCKKSGDAIKFVQERDRLEFKEALGLLAQQAGIELQRFGGSNQKPGERQMLLAAQSAACEFFGKRLTGEEGTAASAYLEKRGFTAESIKRFQVGFAPAGWSHLLTALGKKFAPRQLEAAGLVKANSRGDGYYDTFRNRIIFPIRDTEGPIIAFGGRKMPDSDDPAKYLNSPETPLFAKSRCLYGIDLARQRMIETETAAVVEGYCDVMAAHQFGVSNVVSVLGTALTEQHLGVLQRFARRVVLLFDADAAGDTAVERVVELYLRSPSGKAVEIAIASMPAGMDPDEYLLKFGAEGFEKLLAGATNALDYQWTALVRRVARDKGDMTGQQKAVEQYLELLGSARGDGPVDNLRWGQALARVSRLTDVPLDELQRRFGGRRRPRQAVVTPEATPAAVNKTLTRQDRIERWLLGVLLLEPHRWHQVQQHVQAADFTEPARRALAEAYWAHQRDEGEPVFNEFLAQLRSEELTELAVELVEEIERQQGCDTVLQEAVRYFDLERRRQMEQKQLAAVQRTKDERLAPEEEFARFAEFAKNNQSTNLFRLGPVRRAGS